MFEYSVEATVGAARAGTLALPHGQVRTPAFMPVGTHAVVRGLHPAEIRRAGAQIILANTYHLHLRPGEEVIRAMGGLHQFTTWDRPMLTDSGGFQVFSLERLRRIEEAGVEFTSYVDGSVRVLTPERATEIQWALGADVAMAFDHVVPGQAPHALAREGMERTLRWLERCKRAHEALARGGAEGEDGSTAGQNCPSASLSLASAPPPLRPSAHPQALWPIVQGGTHPDLRHVSLAGTLERGPWSGIAIGGLSVGEPRAETYRVLDELEPELPQSVPRYLMGVGFPPDLLEGIARGIDLFDCVAATRNGRHGTAWLPTGRVNVRSAALRGSREPLDPECDCETCTTFPRGYLRHLFVVEDILGLRLIALHNVRFLLRLGEQARARILDGSFDRWSRDWLDRYSRPRGAS